jgi:hypothetical protein
MKNDLFAPPSKEELDAADSELFAAPSEAELADSTEQEVPGYLETFAHQAPQGLTFGLSDELRGLVNSPSGAGKEFLNKFLADNNQYEDSDTEAYKSDRDKEREILATTQEANPITSILSQLAGGLIPGGLVAKGVQGLAGAGKALTGVQTALRAGALEGGLYGAGQSEAESATGLGKDLTVGAGLGGAIGGAAGLAGKALFGNEADILSKALPDDTIKTKGLVGDLAESRMGKLLKTVVRADTEGVDTNTLSGVDDLTKKTKYN